MPHVNSLLSAFGLVKGNDMGQYTITKVIGTEHSVRRYQQYSYDIEVTLTSVHHNASTRELFDYFNHNILSTQMKILATKNYYECTIDLVDYSIHSNEIIIKLKGNAYRA